MVIKMKKRIIALVLVLITVFSIGVFAANPFVIAENPFAASRDAAAKKELPRIFAQGYVDAYKIRTTKIPALMYHKITDNPAEVTDWVITDKMLADDFAEIKKRGYTPITVAEYHNIKKAATNLTSDDSIKIVSEFFEKNPKPIIITFDDGYKGIYTHVLPLLKEYGFKASFYICGELIDTNHPEYCTWDEITALNDSGLADIGNHTYSLHAKQKNELEEYYKANFGDALADIKRNREVIFNNTGIYTKAFSFPYGLYNEHILADIKMTGYEIFISTDYRANEMTDGLNTLGRFNRPASISTAEFFDTVDNKRI